MTCSNDAFYPLNAEIFYPVVSQGAYGEVTKTWTLDRSVVCSLSTAGSRFREQVTPNVDISLESILIGRFKEDIRVDTAGEGRSITNIAVTNIKDRLLNAIYLETSGVRDGLSTLFEVSTVSPQVGPFGTVEYYRVILSRSENQGGDFA
jgi:hypothetical protein